MADRDAVPTPHDRIVKRVFSRAAAAAIIVRRVVPPGVLARLDLSRIEAQPTTFIPPRLGARYADLLWSIGVRGEPQGLNVFAVVEHRSTPDPLLPLRMLWYVAWLWERYVADQTKAVRTIPLVLPIVMQQHPNRGRRVHRLSGLYELPDELKQTTAPPVELELCIDDLSESVLDDPVAEPGILALVELTRALLFLYHHPDSLTEGRMEQLAGLFDQVLERSAEDAEALWTYVVSVFDERSLLRMTLLEAVGSDNRTMCATIKEAWIAEGRRKGVTQGHAQGLGTALLQLLEHRQLPVSPSIRRRVLETTEHDAVQQWFGRALTASTLDQIFGPSVSTH